MVARRRFLVLILTTAPVVLTVTVVIIGLLYRAAFNGQRARLIDSARSLTRLIEAIARFYRVHSQDSSGGPEAATLNQFADAHSRFGGLGETGESTLARRQGDEVVFLLPQRHADPGSPKSVPLDSDCRSPGWSSTGMVARMDACACLKEPAGVTAASVLA